MKAALLGVLGALIWAPFFVLGQSCVEGAGQVDISVCFQGESREYQHFILGRQFEYKELAIVIGAKQGVRRSAAQTLRLPDGQVFEDTAPRLFHLPDAPDRWLVAVVESASRQGARLALYQLDMNNKGAPSLYAATPYIGRANRWLAPIGIADFDADGALDIAYVEKPHLSREVKLVRIGPGRLEARFIARGLTNHAIGDKQIFGGVRKCGDGYEMLLADGPWQRAMALVWQEGWRLRELGRLARRDDLNKFLRCG